MSEDPDLLGDHHSQSLSSFESELRQMSPSPSGCDLNEVMYQAGYEAGQSTRSARRHLPFAIAAMFAFTTFGFLLGRSPSTTNVATFEVSDEASDAVHVAEIDEATLAILQEMSLDAANHRRERWRSSSVDSTMLSSTWPGRNAQSASVPTDAARRPTLTILDATRWLETQP